MEKGKEKIIELECDYCGGLIKEDSYKCPNCGADCSQKIKKYRKQQEKIAEEKKQEQMEYSKKMADDIGQAMVTPVKIVFVFVFIVILFVIASIFISIGNHRQPFDDVVEDVAEPQEEQKIVVGYNELADGKEFSIILDSYEYYEYTSEHFPESYNTPDGYQKIAFHFIVENKGKRDDYISISDVRLKADDYKVDMADLSTGMFEKAVQGKSDYPALCGNYVEAEEKLQGYVGFLVPKDKKELKFSFEGMTIQMDNPVYQGE